MRRWMRIAALVAALAAASAASADTIDIDGVKRSYTAQLPAKRLVPLVVVLHGKTQRGADMMTRTAWPQVAKREGFAVVFPDGLNHAWADARTKAGPALRGPPAGTDDVAFIAKLVEKLVANGTADPRRVYVTGISNGGAMAMTLVCARADLFAAGASVIMNLTDEAAVTCHPSRPLPMLLMNGTADPLVPYEGGRGRIELLCRRRVLVHRRDAGVLAQAQRLRDRQRRHDRFARQGARRPVHGHTDLLALS
ncbi:poly(3-hydroxybutyrate) depolymerase [Bradyrhizobium sp. LM2.9]